MSLELPLYTALMQEIDCMQQLLGILRQEHDALVNADIAALEQATATKNQALAAQAAASITRQNLTLSSGFANSNEGLQQLIASCASYEELNNLSTRLSSLAQLCQETNRANGRLIVQKQGQVSGALNVIRQTGTNATIYSGQGKTSADQGTRSLGKA